MGWNTGNMRLAPRVKNYAEARAAWERAETWRKRPDNVRILTVRRHRHKQIILNGDDTISFSLHDTNVVTYEPGGDIIIEPWGSMTTDMFAAHFLPTGLHPRFRMNAIGVASTDRHQDGGWWRNIRFYRINGPTLLRPAEDEYAWEVVDAKPWRRLRIDREKMKVAAAETRLAEFCDAAPAMFAIAGYHGRVFWWHNAKDALDCVRAGPTRWLDFVAPSYHRNEYELPTLIAKLRKVVAKRANAYREEFIPFALGYPALVRANRDTPYKG